MIAWFRCRILKCAYFMWQFEFINLSKNHIQHWRSKHFEIRHHFLRDHVKKGDIVREHVNTDKLLAGNSLHEEQFCFICREIGMHIVPWYSHLLWYHLIITLLMHLNLLLYYSWYTSSLTISTLPWAIFYDNKGGEKCDEDTCKNIIYTSWYYLITWFILRYTPTWTLYVHTWSLHDICFCSLLFLHIMLLGYYIQVYNQNLFQNPLDLLRGEQELNICIFYGGC